MKGFFVASLLFAGSLALEESLRDEILNRRTGYFDTHPVSDKLAGGSQRQRKKRQTAGAGEVSGYHVEWFQVFYLEVDDEHFNATQFGSWYEDDVNNATRVEVATYYDADIYPGEYLTLGDDYYSIYRDDNGEVVCNIGTPPSSNNGDYEYIGIAFITFPEDSYPIVWGPRLVYLYLDPSTGESTTSYVGIDAFTDEPVFYSNYNSTFENVFVWSRIHQTDVDANDFVVPDGITCTSVGSDDLQAPWYDQYAVRVAKDFRISNVKNIHN